LSDLDLDSLVRAAVVVVVAVLTAAIGLTVVAVLAAAEAAAVIEVVVDRTTLLVVEGLETVLSAVVFATPVFATTVFSTVAFATSVLSTPAFSSGSELCNNHPKAITDVQRKWKIIIRKHNQNKTKTEAKNINFNRCRLSRETWVCKKREKKFFFSQEKRKFWKQPKAINIKYRDSAKM